MLIYTIHKLGDTALFRCAGRFVSGDTESLRNAIWTQWRSRAVVLDLAQIGSIDAAGIGTLVALRTWAKAAGITFKLMNLTPRVEEMLEVTRVKSAFDICSAAEMLDLLYHAVEQARSAEASAGFSKKFPNHGTMMPGRNRSRN